VAVPSLITGRRRPSLACAGMNNHRRNFTPSDDALIRQQPITGMGLKILETLLRTNREALMRRADELGVSLVISNDHDHDGAIDTRMLRSTERFVDPLLERLKHVHGDRK
jgi:hypothetical protein